MYVPWWVGTSTGCSMEALPVECDLTCSEVSGSAGVAICRQWIKGHIMSLHIVNIWHKYQFITAEAL